MCSARFDDLTSEFPEEAAAIARLKETALRFRDRDLPLNRLYTLVQASSLRTLALIMRRASEAGLARQFYRVESPLRGGIGDFRSLLEIPAEIYDSRQGKEIVVTSEQVKMFFHFPDEVVD
jgi:hypothetical protein